VVPDMKLSFARPKESHQRKRRPSETPAMPVPCRPSGSGIPRNSRFALRQRSLLFPTLTVDCGVSEMGLKTVRKALPDPSCPLSTNLFRGARSLQWCCTAFSLKNPVRDLSSVEKIIFTIVLHAVGIRHLHCICSHT
jgi:hypothetical protein